MAGLADILSRVQGGGPGGPMPPQGGPPMPQGGPPMPQGAPGAMPGLEGLPMPLPREVMIQLIMMILESLQSQGGPQPGGGGMPPQGGPPMPPQGGGGLPF